MLWNWVKSQFKRIWHPRKDLYQITFNTLSTMFEESQRKIKACFIKHWTTSNVFFQICFDTFLFSTTLLVAFWLSGRAELMATIPTLAWIIVGASLLAFLTLLRRRWEPKDTRLDTIIQLLTKLTKQLGGKEQEKKSRRKVNKYP